MPTDFGKWNTRKIQLHNADGTALFQEREVWWCALGANIGFEQDGGNKDFERPVIILKKFNLDACLVVPLTARPKQGKYYLPVGTIGGREAVAVLSQVRFIDRKRLANKICTLESEIFQSLIRAVIGASFTSLPLK
jgi:mRNA interferase MazF